MNLPNLLTLFRLFLIPVYVLMFSIGPEKWDAAAMIFVLASATDVLDGYIARKYNMTTKWGQVFDPLADKCMQISVVLCLFFAEILPVWFVVLLIVKEVSMIFAGIFLYSRKTYVKANGFGKSNTVFLFLVMFLLHFKPDIHETVKLVLLGLSATLAILATSVYIYNYFVTNQKDETVLAKEREGETL